MEKRLTGNKKKKAGFLYLATCAANITSFTVGIAFTWASPVLPKLNGSVDPTDNPLKTPVNPMEESWIVALFYLGAGIGPFISACTVDKIGRKRTLLYFSVPVVAAFVVAFFAQVVVGFYVSRFMLGIGLGCVFSVVPMYVAEIAQDDNRGSLGCYMYMFLTSGSLFALCVGPYLSVQYFCLACAAVPLVFVVVFALFIPESPYYLAEVGQEDAAEESLMRLRNGTGISVKKELMQIFQSVHEALGQRRGLDDIFKAKGLRKALWVSMGLVMFQQFSGINVFMSYLQSIFEQSGNKIPSHVSPIVVGVFQVLACGLTTVLVDKLGRRFLLMTSAIGVALSLSALATFFHMKDAGYAVDAIFWLPLLSIVVYIVTFNVGFGALPFAIIGELFPCNAKATASNMCVSVCQLMAFTVTVLFPLFKDFVGLANSFYIFAFAMALGAAFVYYSVPETKGKSLHEIQEMLDEDSSS